MKTISLSVLLALAIAGIGLAQQESGWNDTRWGMTVEQVKHLYPSAQSFEQPNNHNQGLVLNGFKISNENYDLRFFFDEKGTLSEVDLDLVTPRSQLAISEITASSLRAKLTEKYGQPDFVERGDFQSWKWNKPQLNIALDYVPMFNKVSVSYSKPNPDDLSKL
jgi:hypothetical protein